MPTNGRPARYDEPTLAHDETPPDDVRLARMALVEGSTPCLIGETHRLLRTRLQAATMVLFFGWSTAFVVLRLLTPVQSVAAAHDPLVCEILMFWSHIALVVILGVACLLVCRKCPAHLGRLRLIEVVVFGSTALYLMMLQNSQLVAAAVDQKLLPEPTAGWVLLIYIYALFIPNTWRRAAVVIGALALAPLAVLVFQQFRYPEVAEFTTASYVGRMIVILAVAAGSSIYGAHFIGSLRQEAFAARQLGQYRLRELLGRGGMGEVYLAEHQLLRRPCAIKIIKPSQAGDPKILARFEREVQSTATLSHWNTVDIFDYGHTDDGTFYYVMEYLPGMSLAELVKRHGPLPPERVIYLMRQTCDALHEAHFKGLIHRDIKPGNIFVAQRGGLHDVSKLLDFGLVKPAIDGQAELTIDGQISGSPSFMSPEQALGETRADARSDIYSLGAVAYFLLTGHAPFERDRIMQIIVAHARESVVPPTDLNPDIPADLEAIVLKCLAKNVGDRYQTARELRSALDDCDAAGGWNDELAEAWWREKPLAAEPKIQAESAV